MTVLEKVRKACGTGHFAVCEGNLGPRPDRCSCGSVL
jgi:hypothetical protein